MFQFDSLTITCEKELQARVRTNAVVHFPWAHSKFHLISQYVFSAYTAKCGYTALGSDEPMLGECSI